MPTVGRAELGQSAYCIGNCKVSFTHSVCVLTVQQASLAAPLPWVPANPSSLQLGRSHGPLRLLWEASLHLQVVDEAHSTQLFAPCMQTTCHSQEVVSSPDHEHKSLAMHYSSTFESHR